MAGKSTYMKMCIRDRSPDKKGRLLTDDDCKSLTRSIKHTAVSVKKPRGAEFAQVLSLIHISERGNVITEQNVNYALALLEEHRGSEIVEIDK